MAVRCFTLLIMMASLLCNGSWCLSADELDDLLEGFDEEQSPNSETALDDLLEGFSEVNETEPELMMQDKSALLPSWLELQGSISLQSTINFNHEAPLPGQPDYRGLSMFRGHGELIADVSFENWKARVGATAFYDGAYHLNNQRDLYTDAYLSTYESEVELNEAYLEGSLSETIDVKLGRQIVVWGRSDNLRVTDVLNPLDRRYPGMLDIRYQRLPVTMSRADYFRGDWNFTATLIHEPRFDKLTRYNGEFFPGNQPLPRLETQGWSWENQQVGLALNGIFSGWDLSFYAASIFQERAHLETDQNGAPFRIHNRSSMVGVAGNVVKGSWLFKAEAAYWDALQYSTIEDKKPRLDILAGLEYMGFSETTIALEVVNRHIIDYDPRLSLPPDGQEEDWTQYAFRFVKDFLNDTLHFTFLLSSFGLLGADGGFERIQLEYDVTDNITLLGGVVLYESGGFPGFQQIGDNDRILLELEYRF